MFIDVTMEVGAENIEAFEGLKFVPPQTVTCRVNLDHISWAFIGDNLAAIRLSSGDELKTKVPEEIAALRNHVYGDPEAETKSSTVHSF